MAFLVTGNSQTAGSERKKVDYDALNAYMVQACGGGKKRSLPGIISGIYDLGLQKLDDAAIDVTDAEWLKRNPEFDGDINGAAAQLIISRTKRENVRFEEHEGKMCFRYKQNPVQQIAASVDFPQIMVDKGPHYGGESKPMPLRLIFNGEFKQLVQRPFNLRSMNHAKPGEKAKWALAKNNGLHKLAAATDLLDTDGLFKAERLDELLGKVAQFEIQVFMKGADAQRKGFYNEYISLAGMVPEGMPTPELPENVTLALVQMWDANVDKNAAMEARACIKNHQRKALNFVGDNGVDSPLKTIIGEGFKAEQAKQAAAPKPEVTPIPQAAEGDDSFDSDIPF